MGLSVAVGYAVYRKYLLEIQNRSQKYAEIRAEIRRLLADLLTTPDEDLIRQLHRTIQRIERLLQRHDPKAVQRNEEQKKPRVA
jgi:Na+/phosphate symporter